MKRSYQNSWQNGWTFKLLLWRFFFSVISYLYVHSFSSHLNLSFAKAPTSSKCSLKHPVTLWGYHLFPPWVCFCNLAKSTKLHCPYQSCWLWLQVTVHHARIYKRCHSLNNAMLHFMCQTNNSVLLEKWHVIMLIVVMIRWVGKLPWS